MAEGVGLADQWRMAKNPDLQSDAYHIQSLRSALLVEALGGIKAADSGMGKHAAWALSLRGYSAEEIGGMLMASYEASV